MIDDLDLAFDEKIKPGRHRRRAQRKAKKKQLKKRRSGRGRTIAALLITFLLLGAIGGGAWYGLDRIEAFFSAPDYVGGGTGEIVIEVKEGDTATDIAHTLAAADVVKSPKAFIQAAQADSRSRNIQVGHYKLRLRMSAKEALALLLDPRNRVINGVTIPEGRSAKQTYKLLSEKTGIPVEEFEAAAKDPRALGVPDWWFERRDGKKVTYSIEGFLFPATYEIPPDATAESILTMMVDNFLTVTGEMKFAERVETERGGISPYEALIVASLAQAEAGINEDLGKIARVAYNRVYREDMPLQFDVTSNYGWELQGKETKASKDMTNKELYDEKNPYSTHAHKGLPPTPINNPGQLALEGAMDPPDGDWLFFVAIDKEGRSAFARTDAEHERNKQKARENGVL